MKHLSWLLLVFFAVAATAQQSDANLPRSQRLLLNDAPLADVDAGSSQSASASNQQSKPAEAQKKKPPQPSKPPEIKRPTIDASMVGYIENAIVGSEVRIRFDAAFNDAFPDRAEFIYGKCGCFRNPFLVKGPPDSDPNAPGPGPGTTSGIPKDVNFQELSFMGEYAPRGNSRFSTFVLVPFRWLEPQGVAAPGSPGATVAFSNGAGISDVEAGVKFALLASPTRYLTAQLTSYFPSGSASHGLGTNHWSLEPALLYYQRFSQKFELEGELGGWLPIGGSAGAPTAGSQGFAGNIFFYGLGPSYRLINGEQFRLAAVIELVGWNVTGGQETGSGVPSNAGGTNIVNLKLGARMSFGNHNSVYIGYGRPLTSADWYDDILRVEYRYTF